MHMTRREAKIVIVTTHISISTIEDNGRVHPRGWPRVTLILSQSPTASHVGAQWLVRHDPHRDIKAQD